MHMKYALSIVIALLVVVLGYWLFAGRAESPTEVVTGGDELITGTDVEEGSDELLEQEANEQAPQAGDERTVTFDVKGTNFAFDVTEMTVNQGDTVVVSFESVEGFHDWVLDEFDAATEQVRPGNPTSVTFVANEAGTYEYYCSVGNHRAQGMVGTLTVVAQ